MHESWIFWHDENLSNIENILDVLVNWIKQIYHQLTFDSKMVYIQVDNVLAIFLVID